MPGGDTSGRPCKLHDLRGYDRAGPPPAQVQRGFALGAGTSLAVSTLMQNAESIGIKVAVVVLLALAFGLATIPVLNHRMSTPAYRVHTHRT